jgi:antitoxin component of MazEF toxin-antitoxin module
MQAILEIVYRAQIGQPLTAAVVENRQLLVEAAKAAIAEAHEKAEAMDEVDEFVAELQREEAVRLERVLARLIPELNGHPRLRVITLAETSPQGQEGRDGA